MRRDQWRRWNPWGTRFRTPTNHASPTRSTTTFGVVAAVNCRPWACVTSSPVLFSPQGKLFWPCITLDFISSVFFQVVFLFFFFFLCLLTFFISSRVTSLDILLSPICWTTGSSGPLLCDWHVESAATKKGFAAAALRYIVSPCSLFVGHYLRQSNKESAPICYF